MLHFFGKLICTNRSQSQIPYGQTKLTSDILYPFFSLYWKRNTTWYLQSIITLETGSETDRYSFVKFYSAERKIAAFPYAKHQWWEAYQCCQALNDLTGCQHKEDGKFYVRYQILFILQGHGINPVTAEVLYQNIEFVFQFHDYFPHISGTFPPETIQVDIDAILNFSDWRK